jgi:hypothetical protein
MANDSMKPATVEPASEASVRWSALLAACEVIADECKRGEESASSENEKLWMRAYTSGARRLVHDLMAANV